jgi:hypothetical protein
MMARQSQMTAGPRKTRSLLLVDGFATEVVLLCDRFGEVDAGASAHLVFIDFLRVALAALYC